jgi:hypothetical protein
MVGGEQYSVTASWNPGYSGNREEPPEPEGWDLDVVYKDGEMVDVDEELEQKLYDALEAQTDNDPDDRRDQMIDDQLTDHGQFDDAGDRHDD